tara:strand:- start:517 stop:687 length:171 start_codon:yes stop_codon:yes gene_type:complete
MKTENDDYWDDEGWIWLPHEELMAVQREKNAITQQMLDNVALTSSPHRVVLQGAIK